MFFVFSHLQSWQDLQQKNPEVEATWPNNLQKISKKSHKWHFHHFFQTIFPHHQKNKKHPQLFFEMFCRNEESTDDSDSDLPELYDASESDGQKSPPSKVRTVSDSCRPGGWSSGCLCISMSKCPNVKGCELRIRQMWKRKTCVSSSSCAGSCSSFGISRCQRGGHFGGFIIAAQRKVLCPHSGLMMRICKFLWKKTLLTLTNTKLRT